jgi:hypothetical protein
MRVRKKNIAFLLFCYYVCVRVHRQSPTPDALS